MSKVYLLDCTLRDGGYVNDWRFGENTIRGFGKKLAKTSVDMYEIGFIKGDTYDKDRSVFPNIDIIADIIAPKDEKMMYVGMLDMSAPVPMERFIPKRADSLDAIRVIFKKNKIDEGYKYCKAVKEAGYKLFVQFVSTDSYSDEELAESVRRFDELKPFAMSIVDTFGLIKRKEFLRMVHTMDANMSPEVALGYHAHNNLQLAYGNAENLVELELERDICIDGSIFGMGRGAGNLNMELFADYMNENHGAHYSVEPMLEIM
ncbi:MAG: 3-hydroxy-3-methylglutaryl-CoA lyase, partial [Eubacterium sp.]|nr:3-hydroxy-3-methylglutaryl-CoA lyase [Eubacterium sp.]